MFFFVFSLGIPLVLLFLLISAIIFLPIILLVRTARGINRIINRPPPTDQLRRRLEQIPEPFPEADQFIQAHEEWLLTAWKSKAPVKDIFRSFARTAGTLYATHDFVPLVPAVPHAVDPISRGRYRDEIITGIRTAEDAPRILEIIHNTFTAAYTELARKLPPSCITTRSALERDDEPEPLFKVPLAEMIRKPGQAVADLIEPFHAPEVKQYKLFRALRDQLDRNLYEASGQDAPAPPHKLIHPYEHKGTSQEIIKAYLGYTPLQYLFDVKVPLPLNDDLRCQHWFCIGGSGHGKTTLLQHVIIHDLMQPNPPALFIIDSQGIMLDKIQRLKIFADNPNRLTIIDPEKYTPALNVFDMTSERVREYSPLIREQVEAGIIELYSYIFSGLASELTSKQSVVFSFVVKLMLATPKATLHTLLELMEDPAKSFSESKFAKHAQALDRTARAFFENQFFNKQAFGTTRQGVARRLYAVLSVPAFDRMFSSPINKFNVFKALQTPGSVTLVNTSKALLKNDASSLFGRFMIAQVMAAVFERVAVPEHDRNPAYLIVDEAAEYFSGSDDALESLLSQARKFRLGLLFCIQHMEQLAPALRSSVASNTSIKCAGGVSERDAKMLDADMRTTAQFITSMRKGPNSTQFAAYVRNELATAVTLEIPFGTLESAPKMSPAEHRKLIERNRARYSADPTNFPSEEVESTEQGDAGEEIRPTRDW